MQAGEYPALNRVYLDRCQYRTESAGYIRVAVRIQASTDRLRAAPSRMAFRGEEKKRAPLETSMHADHQFEEGQLEMIRSWPDTDHPG
jgi:hypothetical protein